jgi:hypothetical protein
MNKERPTERIWVISNIRSDRRTFSWLKKMKNEILRMHDTGILIMNILKDLG